MFLDFAAPHHPPVPELAGTAHPPLHGTMWSCRGVKLCTLRIWKETVSGSTSASPLALGSSSGKIESLGLVGNPRGSTNSVITV